MNTELPETENSLIVPLHKKTEETDSTIKKYLTNRDIFVNYLKSKNYKFMITFKYSNKLTNKQLVFYFNRTIMRVNKMIYKKCIQKLRGIVALEKNTSGNVNAFHIHLLLESDSKLTKYTSSQILDIFRKSSMRLKADGKTVFNHKEAYETENKQGKIGYTTDVVHAIECYDDRAVDYVTKDTNYHTDNILFLGNYGVDYGDINFNYIYA